MRIFIPKESKPSEGRVALMPVQVAQLVKEGHAVAVERSAGLRSGFEDADYQQVGAKLVTNSFSAISKADLFIKVKEPTLDEVAAMRPESIFLDTCTWPLCQN